VLEEKVLEVEIEPGMRDGYNYPFISEGTYCTGNHSELFTGPIFPCVCVCVCVCARARVLCVCMCMCVLACVCACAHIHVLVFLVSCMPSEVLMLPHIATL